jgi:hypothetical protein
MGKENWIRVIICLVSVALKDNKKKEGQEE